MTRRVALLSLHSSPLAPIGSDDAGGMNVYVRRLADELCRRGLRADVFTRRTDPAAPEIIRTKDGSRIIHLDAGPARPIPKGVLPLHVPALVESFRSFQRAQHLHYDLIHSHYWLSGLVALRSTPDAGVPVVHMFHTLSKVKEFYAGGPDPRDSALRSDGERIVMEGADVIVGATDTERDYMRQLYGVSPHHYAVVPPGVDLDVFSPKDAEYSRKALGIQSKHVVLFVGRLDGIKGLDLLLRAMAELVNRVSHPVTLIVVGDTSSGRLARYRRMTRALHLEKYVHFRPIVHQAELSVYYSAADVCALPSRYESFGMVAVESMACGTPVVAFAAGGPAVTIRDGDTGFLVKPGDIVGFAAKLQTVLEAGKGDGMSARARNAVAAYSWPSVVTRTLDVYSAATENVAADTRATAGL